MSQNCGLYRPTVHPQVICNVDHGMMILTEANFQLVYQSALAVLSADISGSHHYWLAVLSAETSLAANSTVRRSCNPKHLWIEWAKEMRI
jgi:hypothetical protein